jgi:hypothetical protein
MTEETQTDGPLINLTAPEETPQEAPMSIHEPDPSAALKSSDGTAPVSERPDYIPAKFWGEKGADLVMLSLKQFANINRPNDINTLSTRVLMAKIRLSMYFKNGQKKTVLARLLSKILPLRF